MITPALTPNSEHNIFNTYDKKTPKLLSRTLEDVCGLVVSPVNRLGYTRSVSVGNWFWTMRNTAFQQP